MITALKQLYEHHHAKDLAVLKKLYEQHAEDCVQAAKLTVDPAVISRRRDVAFEPARSFPRHRGKRPDHLASLTSLLCLAGSYLRDADVITSRVSRTEEAKALLAAIAGACESCDCALDLTDVVARVDGPQLDPERRRRLRPAQNLVDIVGRASEQ